MNLRAGKTTVQWAVPSLLAVHARLEAEEEQNLQPHRMFGIPEVVDLVMESYGDECLWTDRVPPLGQCARVSRLWSELALKWLWKDSSLMRFLGLLSPLVHGEGGWTLENNLTEQRIFRFFKYTLLVKELSHEQGVLYRSNQAEEPEFDCSLSDEVFFYLWSLKIPSSHGGLLFPNVDTLGWHVDQLHGISQVLLFRSPHITEYNFSFPFQAKYIPTIRRTVISLMTSTRLQGLWFRFLEKDKHGEVRDEALTDLARNWAQSQKDMTKMELTGFALRDPLRDVEGHHRLDTLRLGTIIYQTLDGISHILKTIASGSPRLTELDLSFRESKLLADGTSDVSSPPFSFSTLHPLLQLVRLDILSIKCDYALPLSEADIKMMGEAWPKMAMLTLCPSPSRSLRAGSPFTTLATFASYFPGGLVWLGHYFVINDTQLPYPSESFGFLSKLDVGMTQLGHRRSSEVVRFLCGLFPFRFWLEWDENSGSHSTWKKTKKQLDSHYPPRGKDDWF